VTERTATDARSFILAAVTLCVTAWEIAFNLGVYEEIFFEKFHLLWVVATTIFLASFALPREEQLISFKGRLVLLLPSTYFLASYLMVAAFARNVIEGESERLLIGLTGLALILIFLLVVPYVLYLVAKIINPDLVTFTRRQAWALAGITSFIITAGLIAGDSHSLLMTCTDFSVSGNFVPHGCTSLQINPVGE